MNAFKKTLILLTFILTVTFTWAQNHIHCNGSGDWDDASNWDLGRTPEPGDIIHIDAYGSIVTKSGPAPIFTYEIHVDNHSTLSLNYSGSLNVTSLIHIDNTSRLNVNCPTTCNFLHLDNSSTICLNADFTACNMDLDNNSRFYGNGYSVTITNCNNLSNPVQVHNGSKFRFNRDCDDNIVTPGNLKLKGTVTLNDCDIIFNDVTIANGLLSTSCNTTILGTIRLDAGGNFTSSGTVTYGNNAKLTFNRDYTLSGSNKLWPAGTGTNVPPTVEVLSGTITTNDTLTVKRRINLIGGTVGTSSGTKIKLSDNDTVYICEGEFYWGGSTFTAPVYGNNVYSYSCNSTIKSIRTGNWNNINSWNLHRVPSSIIDSLTLVRNTDSIAVTSGNPSCKDLLCWGRSKLSIYDTLNCKSFFTDSSNHITKVYGKLNCCDVRLDHGSKVYACKNIVISNCNNKTRPIEIVNLAQLLAHGAPLCTTIGINLEVNGKNVDLTGLCAANISIQTLRITNATVTLDTCNKIVDYIQLNQGGDIAGHAPTWVGQSKLAINRDYTFSSSSIAWQAGTGNVPHTIDILSGNVNINSAKTVVTRMQLLGGVVFGGTNLVFANNSYLFRCGGILNQPAAMGTNVTVEMCSDTNSNNPPATIGSTDMPPGGFTGDLIISTRVVLASNVTVPAGKVIVTSTGILNDSNFTISQATQVTAQSGGVIVTTKSGGLTGPNSLLGSLPTTLSPTSTVQYSAPTGNQTVSQGATYGNIVFTGSSTKTITPGMTTVAGNFTIANGSGTVTAQPGSTITFTGNNQQVSGINYQNVVFSGTGTTSITSTASVAKNMDVVSSVVINTNNNLTLLSGPTGTAQIGPLTNGADVVGDVCWLRYIPGGPSNRRWRFLSNPVLNVTFRWWQNDIFITGPGTGGVPCAWNTTSTTSMSQNSNGFDQNQSLVNSCFTWNETSNSWQTIPSAFNTINPLKAYRTFVRGDRNIEGCLLMTNMPDSVSGVTLHSCGPIVKYTQTAPLTYTPGIGNGWNYVSNPYPCSVDWWNSSWVASRSSSIVPTLYIWVPEKNQYATWSPLAGGINGGTNIIGTGQSFFIKTNAATNLVFEETYKVDSGQIGFFGKTGTNTVSNNLKMKLTSNTTADEALVYINSNASLNYEETYDAYKMGFTTGSIASSTKLNASKLVFNAIGIVRTMDTINLNTYLASASTNYTLDFSGANTFDPQYLILLRDKYLSVITNLMVNRVYTFSTNSSVSGSFDQNRFELIILNSSALPVTLSDFNAEKQTDKSVLVKWSTASESNNSHFIVEHSLDAVNFKPLEVVKGAGNSNSLKNYSYSHMNPSVGMNYYRLTQVDFNNNKHESFIVAVNFTEEKPGTVSLFPVPVSNTLNVNFNNSDYSGNVVVKIYDIVGREMMTQQISVNSNNPVYGIDVSTLNSGSYIISISSNKSQEQKIKFVKD